MNTILRIAVLSVLSFSTAVPLLAQEAATDPPVGEGIRESAENFAGETREKVEGFAEQVDQSQQAHEISAGLLQPIYALAEAMAFPSFHWLAFMFMTAGVISFALQLVLGKLVVLSKMSLSLKEILADALGLVISLIGLVLTTQAAAENSTFTDSPASVLSAAGAGVLLGLIFYWWGQAEEVQAAIGRKARAKSGK